MANPTRKIIQEALEKWTPAALDIDEPETFALPIRILAGEAVDLAHFVDRYWEPQVLDKRPVPGLKQAMKTGLLREGISDELMELQLAMSDQHAEYLTIASSKLAAPVERGEFVVHEIHAALAFLFDDGVSDERDEQLLRFEQAHANRSSHDALALALEAYAHFAEKYRDAMKDLPEFDPRIIDEALVIARQLREQSAIRISQDQLDAQRSAISLRNRFAALLVDRMSVIRSAAKYVFRNHPDIVRKASSSYERDRRARSRRKAVSETTELAPGSVAETG